MQFKSEIYNKQRAASWALAALMAAQAVLGLLLPEQYRDVDWIKTAWIGNDWVTLLLATPLLVIGILLAGRGSVRGLLLWLGALGFAVYNYTYYLFGTALNAFFPIYIAALLLPAVILIRTLPRLDAAALADGFHPGTPVRLVGGYLIFVGTGLGAVWLIMWVAYIFAGKPPPIEPENFKVVAAIDITLIVSLLLSGGVLLWRRQAWGYVLAAMAGILGASYLVVLTVNALVAVQRGAAEAPGEVPIWGVLALLTAISTLLLLWRSSYRQKD